jgi:hypothetical protein
MKKLATLVAIFVVLLLFPSPIFAQSHQEREGLTGEAEVGVNFKGDYFISFYGFYTDNKLNALARAFKQRGEKVRGEFAFGPRFVTKNTDIRLYFGGTTSREAMVAGEFSSGKLRYWGDLKVPIKKHGEASYEQIARFRLFENRNALLRSDNKWKGKHLEYWNLGVEFEQRFNERTTGSVFTFYDLKNKTFGIGLKLAF